MFFQRLFGRGDKVDPRPVAIPAGMKKPETAEERMRRMIRNELSMAAGRDGEETFEEANDFDVDDDDPTGQPTGAEMAAEFLEGVQRDESEQGYRGDPERDTPERERTERDGEASTERSGGNRRSVRDGQEDEQAEPASTRGHDRD